jgi:ATP-dependent helicase/nuclease subunit A
VAVSERPTGAQTTAADPRRSVWVTANAGTGKTRVLTNRVLRLLLAGADPESVLCITFTKAAASEMAARIEKQLADWAVEADAAKLEADLEALIGEPATEPVTDRARRLFAQVLDLPSGLSIMTIHGFCQGLLRRFPLEAGIAPHFELIDERTARELQIEARQHVLASQEPALQAAIADLAVLLGDDSLTDAIAQLLARRQHLAGLALEHGSAAGVSAAVSALLQVRPDDTPATIIERACRAEEVDSRNLVPAANALLGQAATFDKRGRTTLAWLNAAETDRRATVRHVFEAVPEEGRRSPCQTGPEFPGRGPLPRLLTRAGAPGARRAGPQGQEVARRTAVLLTVGYAVIDAYAQTKRQAACPRFRRPHRPIRDAAA